jgi:uncharacterized protein YjbJ (UPF0337 family)
MNWDRIKGSWEQVAGSVKTQWGKLTDDDLKAVAGHRDQLAAWQARASEAWFKKPADDKHKDTP